MSGVLNGLGVIAAVAILAFMGREVSRNTEHVNALDAKVLALESRLAITDAALSIHQAHQDGLWQEIRSWMGRAGADIEAAHRRTQRVWDSLTVFYNRHDHGKMPRWDGEQWPSRPEQYGVPE